MTRERAIEAWLYANRQQGQFLKIRRVIERLQKWDESKTIRENASVIGIKLEIAAPFAHRYGLFFLYKRANWTKGRREQAERREIRHQAILTLRKSGFTLEELGTVLGITRERVRHIEGKSKC